MVQWSLARNVECKAPLAGRFVYRYFSRTDLFAHVHRLKRRLDAANDDVVEGVD